MKDIFAHPMLIFFLSIVIINIIIQEIIIGKKAKKPKFRIKKMVSKLIQKLIAILMMLFCIVLNEFVTKDSNFFCNLSMGFFLKEICDFLNCLKKIGVKIPKYISSILKITCKDSDKTIYKIFDKKKNK